MAAEQKKDIVSCGRRCAARIARWPTASRTPLRVRNVCVGLQKELLNERNSFVGNNQGILLHALGLDASPEDFFCVSRAVELQIARSD